MANNRMYLRCKKCGEVLFLAKTFLDGYKTSNEYYKNKSFVDSFNEFCDAHKWCDKEYNSNICYEPQFKEQDFSEENSFEICYDEVVQWQRDR